MHLTVLVAVLLTLTSIACLLGRNRALAHAGNIFNKGYTAFWQTTIVINLAAVLLRRKFERRW